MIPTPTMLLIFPEKENDMRICHAAIYTKDLERLKDFYVRYFGGIANERYHNPVKGFSSYFIRFGTDVELEIMSLDEGLINVSHIERSTGYSHIAFSAGGKDDVDKLTAMLLEDGYSIVSGPRATGDGHYESCALDPDGNRVEIAAEG
jgi:lactoylglutathione lyase